MARLVLSGKQQERNRSIAQRSCTHRKLLAHNMQYSFDEISKAEGTTTTVSEKGTDVTMGNNEERLKGKAQELKGSLKENAGDLLDNEQMEAEGKAERLAGHSRHEAAEAAERTKGAAEEVTGRVKGAVGDLLDNEQMQAEGKAEQLKGQARQKSNK